MVIYVQRLPKADKQNWLLKALFWRLGCGDKEQNWLLKALFWRLGCDDKENGVSFLQSAAQPSATEKHQRELASKCQISC
jgi:hypothetical protein